MGLSWIEIQSPIDEPLLRIVDVEFLNDDTLFVCISQTYFFEPSAHPYTVDLIVRSSDGGNSWGVQFENYPRHPPKDTSLVQIISVNDSLLISIGYKLLIKTENSGGPVWPVKHVVELKSSNVHRIFPNPAGDKLYASNLQKKCSFSIIDLSGKTLLLGDLEPGNYINIETLNNGIYLIKLFSKQDIILTDIFIKK
jgi:hypothetical protein